MIPRDNRPSPATWLLARHRASAGRISSPRRRPRVEDLNNWLSGEKLADAGGADARKAFAAIADWGSEEEAAYEAQSIARERGIREPVKVEFMTRIRRPGGARISAGWEPYKKVVILNRKRGRPTPAGANRHDRPRLMHARRTLTTAEWENAWAEMRGLARDVRKAKPGSVDGLRAIRRYRDNKLESEAISLGRSDRDRHRR